MEGEAKRPTRVRVLSVQSHVVRGCVGNRCAVPVLQFHGFEVDFINSVQLSTHTHYTEWNGQVLNREDIDSVYQPLRNLNLDNYTHMLTGYCRDSEFLRYEKQIIADQKTRNSNFKYVCDPVLGDNGKLYVPEELVAVYRDEIVPLADVVTPNQFELSKLSGVDVTSEKTLWSAVDRLHELGVSNVVVTSTDFTDADGRLRLFSSAVADGPKYRRHWYTVPLLEGYFVGTGDLFTSLLLVWYEKCNSSLHDAVTMVLRSMQPLLRFTLQAAIAEAAPNKPSCAHLELRIVENYESIVRPAEHDYVTSGTLDE